MIYYKDFVFSKIKYTAYSDRKKHGDAKRWANLIITADTETSKTDVIIKEHNMNKVIVWTMCILPKKDYKYEVKNEIVLYGDTPTEFCDCISKLKTHIKENIIIYFHNLGYDWFFLSQYICDKFGKPEPKNYLYLDPTHPLFIKWDGWELRDSLTLSNSKLEQWCKDSNVEHGKAVGNWDYDKRRNQGDSKYFTQEEIEYIENDVRGLAECIYTYMETYHHRHVGANKLTLTGEVRADMNNSFFKINGKRNAREWFKRCKPSENVLKFLKSAYHGGDVHANRWAIGKTYKDVTSYDFASSYPFCLLAYRYPYGNWYSQNTDTTIEKLRKTYDKHAYLYDVTLINPRINSKNTMPSLAVSKCFTNNYDIDNGRIVKADIVTLKCTNIDLETHLHNYDVDAIIFNTIYKSEGLAYCPLAFASTVWEYFKKKTELKDIEGSENEYRVAKGNLNSTYGMCVTSPWKDKIVVNFNDNTMTSNVSDSAYFDYIENNRNILPYAVGVFCTSFAQNNLYKLGECCGQWYYCDTDSVKGKNWDEDKIKAYNDNCIELLKANPYLNGEYSAQNKKGQSKYLGIAEFDGNYEEFRTMGAKKYVVRSNGELKITIAGVNKKNGAKCLKDNINNFTVGTIFDGATTGKKTSIYLPLEKQIIDGQELGNSIDLIECDYMLNYGQYTDLNKLLTSSETW